MHTLCNRVVTVDGQSWTVLNVEPCLANLPRTYVTMRCGEALRTVIVPVPIDQLDEEAFAHTLVGNVR